MRYDSARDTKAHISEVERHLFQVVRELLDRAPDHDSSKLYSPEKQVYDEYTPKLRELTYGSEEYKQALEEMGPALQHHYETNRHHPEHWTNGINGMSLGDLIEMLADWAAAVKRHADGDLEESLRINKKRFNISDQLYEILKNTAKDMSWL